MSLLRIAHVPPPIVEPDVSVMDAVRVMAQDRVGAVAVVEKGDLLGIFTERDMVNRVVAESRDPDATALTEVMTPRPSTIGPDASAIEALRMMNDGGFRHLPIVKQGRLVGIVSRRDFFGIEKARLEDEGHIWQRI